MILNVDLSATPDVMPVPPAGVYDFTIAKPPEVKPGSKDSSKNVVHIEITLRNEGEFVDKTVMDWIGIDSEMGKVRLKRLFKSMGLEIKPQLDLADLVGKTGRLALTNTTDNSSGLPQQRANIGNYLIPGDSGYQR